MWRAYNILYSIFVAIGKGVGIYTKRLKAVPPLVSRSAPLKRGIQGQTMQKCSTGCRLLLIAPALLILLQVALALHHHHFESYHDDKDSLHSFPAAFCHDHIKLDALNWAAAEVLLFPPSYIRVRNPDNPAAPVTILVSDPPQSRAPPAGPAC